MIAIVVSLIAVCVVIIILEDLLADNVDKPSPHRAVGLNANKSNLDSDNASKTNKLTNSSHLNEIRTENAKSESKCWLSEQFRVVSECESCPQKDNISEQLIVCNDNGYRQRLECQSVGLVYRPCDRSEAHFWTFELIMFCLSIVSTFYVHKRQKYIYRKTIERIERQIAS